MAISLYAVLLIAIIACGVGFLGWVLPGDKHIAYADVALSALNRSTSSTTCVSTGYGASLTPTVTGIIEVFTDPFFKTNNTAVFYGASIRYNTIGVPANGAACGSDTTLGALSNNPPPFSGSFESFTMNGVTDPAKGFTIVRGTTYFFYLGYNCGGANCLLTIGGTGVAPRIVMLMHELE